MVAKINFYQSFFAEDELRLINILLDYFDKIAGDNILLPDIYTIEDKQIEVSCEIRKTGSTEFEVILPQKDIITSETSEVIFARISRTGNTCKIDTLASDVFTIDFTKIKSHSSINTVLARILRNYSREENFIVSDIIYKFDNNRILLSQTLARRTKLNGRDLYFPDKFEVLGGESIFANVSETVGVVYVYLEEDQIFFKESRQRRHPVVNKVQTGGYNLEYSFKHTQEERSILNTVYPKTGKDILTFYDGTVFTYFFMRKFPGIRLSNYLQLNPGRSLLEAIEIMLLCVRAAEEYHKNNLVHCDIKPENIHITPEKPHQVFLLDANSAKPVNAVVTYMNGVTEGYRAPELHKVLLSSRANNIKLTITTAIDVFALLGVFLGILGDKDAVDKKTTSDKQGDSSQIYQFSNKLFSTLIDSDKATLAELQRLLGTMNTVMSENRASLDVVREKLLVLEKNLKNNPNNLQSKLTR